MRSVVLHTDYPGETVNALGHEIEILSPHTGFVPMEQVVEEDGLHFAEGVAHVANICFDAAGGLRVETRGKASITSEDGGKSYLISLPGGFRARYRHLSGKPTPIEGEA